MAVFMRDPDGVTVEVDNPVLVTNLWARGYVLVEDEPEPVASSFARRAKTDANADLAQVTDALTAEVVNSEN